MQDNPDIHDRAVVDLFFMSERMNFSKVTPSSNNPTFYPVTHDSIPGLLRLLTQQLTAHKIDPALCNQTIGKIVIRASQHTEEVENILDRFDELGNSNTQVALLLQNPSRDIEKLMPEDKMRVRTRLKDLEKGLRQGVADCSPLICELIESCASFHNPGSVQYVLDKLQILQTIEPMSDAHKALLENAVSQCPDALKPVPQIPTFAIANICPSGSAKSFEQKLANVVSAIKSNSPNIGRQVVLLDNTFQWTQPERCSRKRVQQLFEHCEFCLNNPSRTVKESDLFGMMASASIFLLNFASDECNETACQKYIDALMKIADHPRYRQMILESFVDFQGADRFVNKLLIEPTETLLIQLATADEESNVEIPTAFQAQNHSDVSRLEEELTALESAISKWSQTKVSHYFGGQVNKLVEIADQNDCHQTLIKRFEEIIQKNSDAEILLSKALLDLKSKVASQSVQTKNTTKLIDSDGWKVQPIETRERYVWRMFDIIDTKFNQAHQYLQEKKYPLALQVYRELEKIWSDSEYQELVEVTKQMDAGVQIYLQRCGQLNDPNALAIFYDGLMIKRPDEKPANWGSPIVTDAKKISPEDQDAELIRTFIAKHQITDPEIIADVKDITTRFRAAIIHVKERDYASAKLIYASFEATVEKPSVVNNEALGDLLFHFFSSHELSYKQLGDHQAMDALCGFPFFYKD